MARPARVSPDRILAAAAHEFAARGYAGARVDRIARRARVNKAMLYYHFGSKQALYRALLRHTFSQVAERLAEVARGGAAPDAQLERAIAVIAEFIKTHEFFPAIMLREIAEGGAHLDRDTLQALAAIPRSVADIFARGVEAQVFRPVHPLAAYVSLIAPLAVFLAAGPIRQELAAQRLAGAPALTADQFVRHTQQMMKRALAARPLP